MTNTTATSTASKIRAPLRALTMLGGAMGYYGVYEVEAAVRPAALRPDILRKWTHRFGKTELALIGADLVLEGAFVSEGRPVPGRDAQGRGRVFVMNHRSALDILVGLTWLEARIVSRGDLARWPVLGYLAKRIGTLFVDRENAMSGARVASAMVRAVEGGDGVLIFPEGTTHAGDEVRPFRPGAASVARKTGAEIVPVGVAYADAHAAFLQESFGAHVARVAGARRSRAAVVVGEPIVSAGRETAAIQTQAHAAVQALVHRARAALGG